MKLDQDDLINILNLSGIEGEQRKEAIRVAEMLLKEKEEEKNANKAPKKPKGEYLVVLKSPGEIPDNTVASVFLVPPDSDHNALLDSVRAATVDYNNGKSRKKSMLVKFFDILLFLKPKWQKPHNFKILTKNPVITITLKPGEEENFISSLPQTN